MTIASEGRNETICPKQKTQTIIISGRDESEASDEDP